MDQQQDRRLFRGLMIGPLVPILLNAVTLWKTFWIALIVGLIIGYMLTIAIAAPLVFALQRRGGLRLHWIVLAAGILSAIPDLMISLMGMMESGLLYLDEAGVALVKDGHLTRAGIAWFFGVRPAAYWLMGALGGLVFWVVAMTPRTERWQD